MHLTESMIFQILSRKSNFKKLPNPEANSFCKLKNQQTEKDQIAIYDGNSVSISIKLVFRDNLIRSGVRSLRYC